MCMVEWDDGGRWETVDPPKMRTARKAYVCGECGRNIPVGEQYEHAKHRDDYGLSTQRTCAHCAAVRSWLVVQCGGWLYGGVYEDLRQHWDEEWLLRSMYLGRAIVGMRCRWWRNAARMPVPPRYERAA